MARKKSGELISLSEAKRWLRRYLIRLRQNLPHAVRQHKSRLIVRRALSESSFRKAKNVALFIGFGSEVYTDDLFKGAWKARKNVLIPIMANGFKNPYFVLFRKGDRLKKTAIGSFELEEKRGAFDFGAIDLVIVPGLGFDKRRHRIGYGGGVYDRILEATPEAKHMGLFYSEQELNHLPVEKHDQVLDAVVTEKGVLA